MLTKLIVLLLILLHEGSNSPLRLYYKRSTKELKTHGIAVLVPISTQRATNVILADRQKKGRNYPIQHHLLLPTNLHVIPAVSNIHHSTIHTDSANPLLSHVTHGVTNITHPLILIPIHNLVPVHDLTVIPLQRNRNVEKISHYRAMEKKDEEEVNRYRTYYGGYGTGLYFGGHGAGHGFYAYG